MMVDDNVALMTEDESCLPVDEAIDYADSRRAVMLCKRIVDVVAAGGLLVVLLPLFALLVLGVVLTSRGPAFYTQRRVGLGGRQFRMCKFRSMYTHACTVQPVVKDGALVKAKVDPRVTRLGRLLRRTSLDELPQLWNVLRGDMSIIGPRPLPENMLTAAPHLLAERATVRPGITGLWQIRNRKNNRSIDDMLVHDLEYVRELSLVNDGRILTRTVSVVIAGHGAF